MNDPIGKPYIELVRSSNTVSEYEILSDYGLFIAEFQKKKANADAPTDLKLILTIDMSGSVWRPNEEFFLVGHADHRPNIPTNLGEDRVQRFGPVINPNWLEPPIQSYLFIILTHSNRGSFNNYVTRYKMRGRGSQKC